MFADLALIGLVQIAHARPDWSQAGARPGRIPQDKREPGTPRQNG